VLFFDTFFISVRITIMTLPVVVLISGNGSNLQALIDAAQATPEIFAVAAVISNKVDAYGLTRAHQAGIATETLDHKKFSTRADFDNALQTCIDAYTPGLVALAGFMRILSPEFVRYYYGRLINIHPSLLPAFRGLHTHQRALDAGVKEHGASVHFVTPELDAGPLILQARVAVEADDTAASLAQRVLHQEHRIYPQAVRCFAQGNIRLDKSGQVIGKCPPP
jgi:phosphoribosylglycinamide formyltransferase 1